MQGRTVAIVAVVSVIIMLLLIGFWPLYSQPWMEVVLERIGKFVVMTIAIILLLVVHWSLWFGHRL